MMNVHFHKYQGCGNDFILFDNRSGKIKLNKAQVKELCDRHFGIGADGLMLLQSENGYDFRMVYFNSDGNESSLCGNGGRCITAFAKQLGIIKDKAHFIASDGGHVAEMNANIVALKMNDVHSIESHAGYYFANTGSPHVVKWVDDIEHCKVFEEGRKIRLSEPYNSHGGTNVNFIQLKDERLFVRTYERGVEDETLACGTGVTAAALVAASLGRSTAGNECSIHTLGGALSVSFEKEQDAYTNIWLKGPAAFVFEGEIEV